MAKKQVLKNQITWKNGTYSLTYFAEVDGQETQIGKFQAKRLDAIIACRELLANLPNLASKLEAIADLENWFQMQLKKIDERIKSPKTTKVKKAKSEEDKDKVLRDFLAKLGK